MPRQTKPFIDKKNATTYHVYHRSQRDTENVTGSSSVLIPTGGTCPPSDASMMDMSVLEKELDKIGVLQDDATEKSENYNYSQHLRPISGSGVFYSKEGKVKSNYPTTSSLLGEENVIIEEAPRQLDSIMLSTECMDEEVAHVLFDEIGDDEFEEILDDFCFTANQEVEEQEDDEDHVVKVIEFNYEKHIEGLLRKAKHEEEQEDDVSLMGDEDEDHATNKEFFQGVKPLNAREIMEDWANNPKSKKMDDDLVTTITYKTNQSCSLQKLEETLAEYDSDEIGSLEQECEEIQVFRNTEEEELDNAMSAFLQESKDDFYIRGEQDSAIKDDKGGSGFKALVGTALIPVGQLTFDHHHQGKIENLGEMLQEADDILAQPYIKPPVEDVFIDGKSYFSSKSHSPWDCETILSTYSNLDNHPTTIGRKKKNKPHKPQIQLSSKTGLPIFIPQDYYNEEDDEEEEEEVVNLGVRRNKKETLEDKKARKEMLKCDRREKREQKQQMKVAFKDEFQKQSTLMSNDDVAGKSVFRYG